MNKIVKILFVFFSIVLGLIIAFYGVLYLWINSGDLNFVKKNEVKKNALEYISSTYPGYVVENINVGHEWKSNIYVVSYSNAQGEERELTYDYTGKNLRLDDYIERQSWNIIYGYTNSINVKLDNQISQKVRKVYYVIVDDYKTDAQKRDIVLSNIDITNDLVDCTIGFSSPTDEIWNKVEFAKVIVKSYKIIKENNIPIKSLKFTSQNSPKSRFDLTWSEEMINYTPEKISEFKTGEQIH